jgi:hypothetical protein
MFFSKQSIGYKWVYTVKVNLDGFVELLKARLVAKQYTRSYSIDYNETLSLAAKISSIWVYCSCH